MVDKRIKMIDNNRVVYECIKCKRRYIGSLRDYVKDCPFCKWEDTIVIVENLLVINK